MVSVHRFARYLHASGALPDARGSPKVLTIEDVLDDGLSVLESAVHSLADD